MTMPSGSQRAGRRAEILRLVRENNAPVGITEIAQRFGIHANTVRFHLETLVANGQVERTTAETGTPGRPAQLFAAVDGMDPMGPRHYESLAEALATGFAAEPDRRDRAQEAGRLWGRLQAARQANVKTDEHADEPVERLRRLLDELGFAPEEASGDDHLQIGLRNCPFLELAVHRSDVVCPVHLGLMQGAMESWSSPVTVERLDAFVEPGLCMAHLNAADGS